MPEDGKSEEKKERFSEEKRLGEIASKLNEKLMEEMKGRPYLMVIATGYEIGREGEKSLLASQWAWRSNVYIGAPESKTLMGFLIEQLKDAAEHEEVGIKKQYKMK
ncbi:MAG: hypothetical protein N3F07_01530 [Candidatus Micrarchaeota archaeon]|nr:hypothetical protein [Candidatus Micrarchaeota archaeon]